MPKLQISLTMDSFFDNFTSEFGAHTKNWTFSKTVFSFFKTLDTSLVYTSWAECILSNCYEIAFRKYIQIFLKGVQCVKPIPSTFAAVKKCLWVHCHMSLTNFFKLLCFGLFRFSLYQSIYFTNILWSDFLPISFSPKNYIYTTPMFFNLFRFTAPFRLKKIWRRPCWIKSDNLWHSR